MLDLSVRLALYGNSLEKHRENSAIVPPIIWITTDAFIERDCENLMFQSHMIAFTRDS